MKINFLKLNKIFLLLLISFLLIICTSCNKTKTYESKDYILEVEYKNNFRVLQLTDIHLANKDDRERQYDFLRKTIEQANANMIVITGDSFTFGDRKVAKELFSFLDSFEIPWTITFGNHDEQCYFSIDWLTRYLNKLNDSNDSYCVFKDIQDDDVNGNSNFAINLMEGSTIKHQIIIMDSNRYNYGEYVGYDYIKDNQIEWYERIVNYTKELNGGTIVPSSIFFHIPLPEYDTVWNAYENNEEGVTLICGEKNEKSCPPEKNTNLYAKIKELGSTKLIAVGHDHKNNFIIDYHGIIFSYGVNATDRIYYEDGMLGGTIYIINDNITFEQILNSLEDYQ